ncbi:MAG: bifunctional [glutamine synthetase] adenylyltransferase/[glutamine synthetase]-adenylyl-L-tyrosine phosphorylase [Actinomycetales bacterium]
MADQRHTTAALARAGFNDAQRAAALLAEPVLDGLVEDADTSTGLVRSLARAADPEQAVLGLVRFLEAAADQRRDLAAMLAEPSHTRDRLIAVLGASTALTDQLVRHPDHWKALALPAPASPAQLREDLLAAVGADPDASSPVAQLTGVQAQDALRVAYRRRLLALAGRDLAHGDPVEVVYQVSMELADLASAALEAALAVARAETPEHEIVRLVVIGMGKCGGRELNYVSDVDVIYVAEPVEGADEAAALAVGASLAQTLAGVCSTTTREGTLWPVDAALRPEGKDGPLVRTVSSHLRYYKRWAKTWEFQALLKARPVAGDADLGRQYLEAVQPLVWSAVRRENFVVDVQAMRRRVESHVPARESERQLKLGRGGLRDVEFSVQLLQLVHGRTHEQLRSPNTLEALEELSTYGFIGRDDAAALDHAYRQLRTLEHRLQLARMRRTHVMPTAQNELLRLARASRLDGVKGLDEVWRKTRAVVRPLHERLFYRPILAAVASLSEADAQLSTESARDRLKALGYHDPAGALRSIEALIDGVSRRAAIQRQLLPVLLGWFAEGADPDGGLLAFRKVSETLGSTHWYLKMLRDSGVAAERMARLLSHSRYVADLMVNQPEVARWLDEGLSAPDSQDELTTRALAVVSRHQNTTDAIDAVRKVRTREVLRTAIGDVAGQLDVEEVGRALSQATVATLEGALRACERDVIASRSLDRAPSRLAIIAMGRLGGGELSYGSDADAMFVHAPVPGVDEGEAGEYAHAVASMLQRVLKASSPQLPVLIDAALRPEGRDGPLVRSLDSYRQYYARWSAGWEAQALLRASPVAGDTGVRADFMAMIDPLRYPEGGLSNSDIRELRRIKARVEGERLPRGVLPKDHIKLGPGGIADVEWTVQFLQLSHAHEVSGLRDPRTLPALRAAEAAGLMDAADAEALREAWILASRMRNAIVLWRGRASDVLPTSVLDLEGVSRLLGYEPASTTQLMDDVRRTMRVARVVVNRVFYGEE